MHTCKDPPKIDVSFSINKDSSNDSLQITIFLGEKENNLFENEIYRRSVIGK